MCVFAVLRSITFTGMAASCLWEEETRTKKNTILSARHALFVFPSPLHWLCHHHVWWQQSSSRAFTPKPRNAAVFGELTRLVTRSEPSEREGQFLRCVNHRDRVSFFSFLFLVTCKHPPFHCPWEWCVISLALYELRLCLCCWSPLPKSNHDC